MQNRTNSVNFSTHYDGLGTFLNIAANTIREWADSRALTPTQIELLRNDMHTALCIMGEALELLAGERLDCTESEPYQNTVKLAAIAAGRAMITLGEIGRSLDSSDSSHPQHQRRRQDRLAELLT